MAKPAPDQPDEEELLKQRVDAMMDLKGPAPAAESEEPSSQSKSEISEVAASVNQKLSKDLGVKINVTPKTAPELPDKTGQPAKPTTAAEPALPTEPAPKPDEVSPMPAATDPLSDSETDKAVDDIAAKEADTVLALEDAGSKPPARPAKSTGGGGDWRDKLKSFFGNKWTWLGLGVLVLVLLALPFSRYRILGLAIKKSVTVSVVDSKTARPVSAAEIELGGAEAKTDSDGKATLKAGLGKQDLTITKRYYRALRSTYFVGFKSAGTPAFKLTATGRLVPITVVNTITGKPLGGVQVQVQGTSAKTDGKGQAEIALPATAASFTAKLSLSGYNTASVTIQVTDQTVAANQFNLTPAGQVYFLSNLSGNLDVVKSNLDGTGRKTVLPGTGQEDPHTTSLLASRDWRYLVLKAHRDGNEAALYVIDTSTDRVATFDNSDADFQLIGWYGHNFIYSLTRHSLSNWQAGREQIKSFDADHQQLNQLDQNQAEGDSTSYAYQNFFNFYILNGALVYNTEWVGYSSTATPHDLSGKADTIRAVQSNGQNKKDYQSYATNNTNYVQSVLYQPQSVYYAVYDANAKPTYFVFNNLSVKTANIDQTAFTQAYPTFLVSPSGNQTFWAEQRDGKNTLFTGDDNAGGKKQLASLSDYSPYGWFSDNYLLVSKSDSELYVTSPAGLQNGRLPLKVTDYYKPAQTYAGYGYGYGGL